MMRWTSKWSNHEEHGPLVYWVPGHNTDDWLQFCDANMASLGIDELTALHWTGWGKGCDDAALLLICSDQNCTR